MFFKGLIQRQKKSGWNCKLHLPLNGHEKRLVAPAPLQTWNRSLFTSTHHSFAENHIQEAKRPGQDDLDMHAVQEKEKQVRTPWHREGSDVPPVGRQRSAGAMTKGETISMHLKIVILIQA